MSINDEDGENKISGGIVGEIKPKSSRGAAPAPVDKIKVYIEKIREGLNGKDQSKHGKTLRTLHNDQIQLGYRIPMGATTQGFPNTIFITGRIGGKMVDLVGWDFANPYNIGSMSAGELTELRRRNAMATGKHKTTRHSDLAATALNKSSINQAKLVVAQLNFNRKNWSPTHAFASEDREMVLNTIHLMRNHRAIALERDLDRAI